MPTDGGESDLRRRLDGLERRVASTEAEVTQIAFALADTLIAARRSLAGGVIGAPGGSREDAVAKLDQAFGLLDAMMQRRERSDDGDRT